MTKEELLHSLDWVYIEYEYKPVNYQPKHPVVRPSTERTFFGDASCKSNILGADNDDAIKMLCYDYRFN